MSYQSRSMPPPLIPLPSPPTRQNDSHTVDPFDSLFSDPSPSKPIFMMPSKTSERVDHAVHPHTPPSAASDFGAFVSVPASMDPLQQPAESQVVLSRDSNASPLSEFFDRFTVEARERAGQNERRVLDELLEHEDDPLYWITPQKSPDGEREEDAATGVATLIELDHPSLPSEPITSPRHSVENENTTRPHLPENPPDLPEDHRHPSTSLPPSRTATLPRKWISTLLSTSTPSLAPAASHNPGFSPPQYKQGLSRLTHSSPFASHVYVPPSGAPGFAGDHHWNNAGFEYEARDEKLRGVELTGRRESTTAVLTPDLANQLRTSLPALPRLAKTWSLLYSLDQHGVSLQTLYARCAVRVAGTLIVIRDSEDLIFGVWVGEQLRMSPGAYYGSGESFLWKSIAHHERNHLEVFKWTGKNDYVALCEATFISFGGGEGKYGLYLDSSLIDGSSARCPTFDNVVLCASIGHDESKTVPFECVGVEVWGVTS